MKRVNKVGPELIRNLSDAKSLKSIDLSKTAREQLIIDTRSSAHFAIGHVPGTINIPSNSLVQWAGFFVDYRKPLYLLTDSVSLSANLRALWSIGIDNVQGYFDIKADDVAKGMSETYASANPLDLVSKIEEGTVHLLDVRAATEFNEGHIVGAEHRFLGKLLRELPEIAKSNSKPVVVQCLAGGRSAIAASILQRAGFSVTNMTGGYKAWRAANLPNHLEVASPV
jgi:hydroxyacylglutathione hydrolase